MMRQAITTFMAIARHRARAWLFPLPRTPSAAGAGWCMYSLGQRSPKTIVSPAGAGLEGSGTVHL